MYYGNWSEDAFAFEVLKAGVDLWLTASRPNGEAILKPKPNPNPDPNASGFIDSFFDPSSTPENIARFILANLTWLRREDEGKRR